MLLDSLMLPTLGTAPSCPNINSRAQSRVHKDMDEEETDCPV